MRNLWEKWLGPRRRSDAQTHPGLFRRRMAHQARMGDNQLFRELKKSRRTRLISAARYGKNQRKQREHLEDIFGEERPKVKNSSGKYKRVFEHYQKIADAFGLVLTPLLPTRTPNYTEGMPLLLHRADFEPYQMDSIEAQTEREIRVKAQQDPLWGKYRSTSTSFKGCSTETASGPIKIGPSGRCWNTKGRTKPSHSQRGTGKHASCKAITYVLRQEKQGPTLMISPIIALRDDRAKPSRRPFLSPIKSTHVSLPGRVIGNKPGRNCRRIAAK